jgi:hypothetical protein
VTYTVATRLAGRSFPRTRQHATRSYFFFFVVAFFLVVFFAAAFLAFAISVITSFHWPPIYESGNLPSMAFCIEDEIVVGHSSPVTRGNSSSNSSCGE